MKQEEKAMKMLYRSIKEDLDKLYNLYATTSTHTNTYLDEDRLKEDIANKEVELKKYEKAALSIMAKSWLMS